MIVLAIVCVRCNLINMLTKLVVWEQISGAGSERGAFPRSALRMVRSRESLGRTLNVGFAVLW
jgi:hypothetical protein